MSARAARRGALAALLVACAVLAGAGAAEPSASPPAPATALATFAGGCFWCMEPPFEALPGVLSVTSGYTGGTQADPSYEEVSAGGTGHAEAVEIVFDPAKLSYEKLLEVFWHQIDPLAVDRQFCDEGSQYRSAIFTHGAEQQRLAEASKRALEASGKLPGRIATQSVPAGKFWPAEAYHQDYAKKHPVRYRFYRHGCGRDERLKQLWGDAAPGH